jgi:hypothetical protein
LNRASPARLWPVYCRAGARLLRKPQSPADQARLTASALAIGALPMLETVRISGDAGSL